MKKFSKIGCVLLTLYFLMYAKKSWRKNLFSKDTVLYRYFRLGLVNSINTYLRLKILLQTNWIRQIKFDSDFYLFIITLCNQQINRGFDNRLNLCMPVGNSKRYLCLENLGLNVGMKAFLIRYLFLIYLWFFSYT